MAVKFEDGFTEEVPFTLVWKDGVGFFWRDRLEKVITSVEDSRANVLRHECVWDVEEVVSGLHLVLGMSCVRVCIRCWWGVSSR